MTDKLDLSPIIDGYKWMLNNPQYVEMENFLCLKATDPDTGNEQRFYINFVELPLKEDVSFCLATACLLVDSLNKGKDRLVVFDKGLTPVDFIIRILQERNPDYTGYWTEVRLSLANLFCGQWYRENLNTYIEYVTMPQVKQGILALCNEFAYKTNI